MVEVTVAVVAEHHQHYQHREGEADQTPRPAVHREADDRPMPRRGLGHPILGRGSSAV